MLKQTFLNALFTGFAQGISLLVIISLAGVLEAERFGILSMQLSAAALLSIICTLQFERVYVRVRSRALAHYVAFHLRCLFLIFLIFLVVSQPFKIGPSSVFLASAIAISQIALYSAARQGHFRRIWLMKILQAAALLVVSIAIYLMGQEDLYWLAFLGSYLSAGLVVLDKPIRSLLTTYNLRNDARRFTYSLRIAAMALGSLLSGSFTREFPVLLSGAMGQVETAGTLGLVMRTVGAPIGLLARSASAVVANHVASGSFDITSMIKLAVIPLIAFCFSGGLIIVSFHSMTFEKYAQFPNFLMALIPFLVFRSYLGLLGSALIFYNLQATDLLYNILIAFFCLVAGGLIYLEILEVNVMLWSISVATTVLGMNLIVRLNEKLPAAR